MICHYNSAILKSAIIILYSSESCYFIRLSRAFAHNQAVYVYVYVYGQKTPTASLPPFNDVWAPLVRFFFNLCFQNEAMDAARAYADLGLWTIRGRAGRLYGTRVMARIRRCASRRLRQASQWLCSSNREDNNGIS